MLLLSCAYAGCAPTAQRLAESGRVPEDPAEPRPRTGGRARVLVGGGFSSAAVVGDPLAYLQGVDLVPDQGTPDLLLRLDEADIGLLFGRQANSLLRDPHEPLGLERTPQGDRVYFLWLDPARRWTNDPRFRRWLAGTVDREAMLRYLFDGRGEAVFQLLGEEYGGPVWEPWDTPPFSRPSRPRIVLVHDGTDPFASDIASRVRAALELAGLRVELRPRGGDGSPGFREQDVAARLLLHRPRSADPLAGLTESLAGLPGVTGEVEEALRRGAEEASAEARLAAARRAEASLLREARLVPLVRLHAWLAVNRSLRDAKVGAGGTLSLRQAWWSR
jgi:MarR-like DNA-binding transcriptional regulator SgrR of sgrS sRNA